MNCSLTNSSEVHVLFMNSAVHELLTHAHSLAKISEHRPLYCRLLPFVCQYRFGRKQGHLGGSRSSTEKVGEPGVTAERIVHLTSYEGSCRRLGPLASEAH